MKIKISIYSIILFFGLFGLTKISLAATINAASCSWSDVQAKVNASVTGDTVLIPAGNCDWGSNYINFSGKGIIIKGAGEGVTNISVATYAFYSNFGITTNNDQFRISGMTISGIAPDSTYQNIIKIDGMYTGGISRDWRIDHVTVTRPTGNTLFLFVLGPQTGLVDHITFNVGYGIFLNSAAALNGDSPYSGSADKADGVALGTEKAIYVEDCTISFSVASGNHGICDYNGGGRYVFRNNTIKGGYFYSHETRGNTYAMTKLEAYHNIITGNAAYNGYPARLMGGTGVLFENQISNYTSKQFALMEVRGQGVETAQPMLDCNGSRAWDGNTEGTGWPCNGQVGRGATVKESIPIMAWKNGPESDCLTGGAGCTEEYKLSPWNQTGYIRAIGNYIKDTPHSNGDIDYCNHDTYTNCGNYSTKYVPYVYPHPLQNLDNGSSDTTAPAAPSGLSVK